MALASLHLFADAQMCDKPAFDPAENSMRCRSIAPMAVVLASPLAAQQSPAAQFATASAAAQEAREPGIERRRVTETIDLRRLLSDRAYAEAFLRSDEWTRREPPTDSEMAAVNEVMRAFAFVGAGRRGEAAAATDRALARAPAEPGTYTLAWMLAAYLEDAARAVAAIEGAARNVPAAGWPALHVTLNGETVAGLYQHLRERADEALRRRFAEAIVAIDWPGEGDLDTRDEFRMEVVADRIARGDREGAGRIARTIVSPNHMVTLLAVGRYYGLIEAGDPVEAIRAATERFDRLSAAAIAARPNDPRAYLNRVLLLRSLGRSAEALALLAPVTGNVERAPEMGETGFWLVNEAANALADLGRAEEAIALMERLIALGLERHSSLISQAINLTAMLRQVGRPAESLAWAQRLQREHGDLASPYGRMWIASSIVCALADLGQTAEVGAAVDRMRGESEANPSAMTRALLCADYLDGAERLVLNRLAGDDPDSMVAAFQIAQLSRERDQRDPIYRRLDALRERPAVSAALNRAGRVLRLPLARIYWGAI